MKRPASLVAAQLWGIACGAALGALRTREESLHLLAKDRALEAAGVFPLPGNGHWETLASWAPAVAGALFFGLSLGLGLATLVALWCRACNALGNATPEGDADGADTPQRSRRWVRLARRFGPWGVLAAPAWALARGDLSLAAALTALIAGVVWSQAGLANPSRRALVRRAALLAWFLPALVPWVRAPEGAFTRLRDQWLLPTPVGSVINDFYYRWTLYPAEALKPLAARSQPTVWVAGDVPPAARETFCAQATAIGLLCVGGREAADLSAASAEGNVALLTGSISRSWPRVVREQRQVWRDFSEAADRSIALRKTTAVALFFGGPLALCWAFSSLAAAAGDLFGRGKRGTFAAHVAAAFLAASLFSAGLPDPSRVSLRETLSAEAPDAEAMLRYATSTDPVERFYAVRAAGRAGAQDEALLLQALSDPVINVRYAAAEALGRTDGPRAREALREVLLSPEAWYVKERAYAGLWRLGWRPE